MKEIWISFILLKYVSVIKTIFRIGAGVTCFYNTKKKKNAKIKLNLECIHVLHFTERNVKILNFKAMRLKNTKK